MLTAGEKSSVFGFARGCYDARYDRGNCRDSAVDSRGLMLVPQEEDATDDGTSHGS